MSSYYGLVAGGTAGWWYFPPTGHCTSQVIHLENFGNYTTLLEYGTQLRTLKDKGLLGFLSQNLGGMITG